MPTFELLFRVGDNPGQMGLGAWKDGMIIDFKRRGEDFVTSELVTWIGTYGTGVLGADPTGFSATPESTQVNWRRRMKQLNYLLHSAVQSGNATALETLRAIRFPEGYTSEEERLDQIGDIQAMAREADRIRDLIVSHGGIDTNWGYTELKVHGVVCVDLTYEQVINAKEGPTDETVHPILKRKAWARSGWRVKYESFMTAARIARIRDREDIVPVNRTTIYTPAQALERVIRV